MKITIITSPSLPVPPLNGYGGSQRGVWELIDGLKKNECKIELFAPMNSTVNVDSLKSNINIGIWEEENSFLEASERTDLKEKYDKYIMDEIFAGQPDIINIHYDSPYIINELCKNTDIPIIYSPHNRITPEMTTILNHNQNRLHIVALSVSHYNDIIGSINNNIKMSVIMYGINPMDYPYTNSDFKSLPIFTKMGENKDYILSIGKICKAKGQLTAIKIARELNKKLVIAGSVFGREIAQEQAYFENVIQNVDDKLIYYFGSANEVQKKELMRNAAALLYTGGAEDISWREPFGRVLVESMATGTPVIAWNQGAIKEIVINGKNGYIVESVDEAKMAIEQVHQINRRECREHVLKSFNSERIAKEYLKLFTSIIIQRMPV